MRAITSLRVWHRTRGGRIAARLVATASLLSILLLSVFFFSDPGSWDPGDLSLQFMKPIQRPVLAQSVSALGLNKEGWAISRGVLTNLGTNTTDSAVIGAIDRVLRHLRCKPERLEYEQRLGCAIVIRDPERRWCKRECTSWYGVEFRFFPLDAGQKIVIVQLPSTFCGSGGCIEQLYAKRRDGWNLVADIFGIVEISDTRTNRLPELIIDGQFRLVAQGEDFIAKAL